MSGRRPLPFRGQSRVGPERKTKTLAESLAASASVVGATFRAVSHHRDQTTHHSNRAASLRLQLHDLVIPGPCSPSTEVWVEAAHPFWGFDIVESSGEAGETIDFESFQASVLSALCGGLP
jgi:hypothetical protein